MSDVQWVLRTLWNVDQEIKAWKLRHVGGYKEGSKESSRRMGGGIEITG